MKVFNIRSYGANADGGDDQPAVLSAMKDAAAANGAVYIPAGDFVCARPIQLTGLRNRFGIFGDGQNVSRLLIAQDGIRLGFEQDDAQQPYGVVMRGFGIKARGDAGRALAVSYGSPAISNDHYRPAVALSEIQIESSNDGSFADGILIEGAWNPRLHNVYISGSAHGAKWNELSGTGLELRGMCINAHLSNVTCNFWQTGFKAHASAAGNTEGIFASNCSMVGTQRGVWIAGTQGSRISTFTWKGGMIEGRFTGVLEDKGKAAVHLQNVWTALIQGAQLLGDTLELKGLSYGIVAQDCHGVVASGCDINAFSRGFLTTGDCRSMNVNGNTFTNVSNQVHFTGGTSRSRSYGNTCVNNAPAEFDDNLQLAAGERNRMGFV